MGRNREKEEEELLYKNDDDDDEGVKKNEKCLGKVIVEYRKLLRIIVELRSISIINSLKLFTIRSLSLLNVIFRNFV